MEQRNSEIELLRTNPSMVKGHALSLSDQEVAAWKEEVRKGTMISDLLRARVMSDKFSEPHVGTWVCGGPNEMEMTIDFTSPRGRVPGIYYGLAFQLPKWDYNVAKVDESIEVSPTYVEYYNLTVSQKEKIEANIKQGLTSAAQSVADYELLKHDLRRYEEVLQYFKTAQKEGDEHVLRSLFIDRVDAHVGEPFSMVSMTKRWPTIITDFIRMKSQWNDIDTIRKELDVSQAEATVLKNKNELYKQWKIMFQPDLRERVARIKTLVKSRKASIDAYRDWLKPYVARMKMMREGTQTSPSSLLQAFWITPGFGQAQAVTTIHLWSWKGFTPGEKGKPEKEIGPSGFIIDPFDDLVHEYIGYIERIYDVKISDAEVRGIMKGATKTTPKKMDPNALYYVFFDFPIIYTLMKTPPPEGGELDNMMFVPAKAWFMSQNILLIHLIELHAKEKAFEKHVETLIGSPKMEQEESDAIDRMFQEKEEEKKRLESMSNAKKRLSRTKNFLRPHVLRFWYLFVRPGPYESVFKERFTKLYARGIGGQWGEVRSHILKMMDIE